MCHFSLVFFFRFKQQLQVPRAVPWGACLMKSLVSYTAYRLSPVAQALHGTLAEWDLHAF